MYISGSLGQLGTGLAGVMRYVLPFENSNKKR
jgi:hypothetical protein